MARTEWRAKEFTPGLVKTRSVYCLSLATSKLLRAHSDSAIHIDTPFSRLLDKPLIMVAGMAPTTVKAGFVSAVFFAGYCIKRGRYNSAARLRVDKLT